MEPRIYERTLHEARMDADFNVRLNEMQECLLTRLHWLLSLLCLVAGTTAFTGWLALRPALAGVSGLAVAVLSLVSTLTNLQGRAAVHRAQRRRYLELLSRDEPDLKTFDACMRMIETDDPVTINVLRVPAYNDNLRRHGQPDYALPENFFHRMFSAFV